MSESLLSSSATPSSLADPQGPAPKLQQRMASLVESLPDAVLCLDRTWHITYANLEAVRLGCLNQDLFPSATFWELCPSGVGTEVEERFRAAMESGQPDHFESRDAPFAVWVHTHLIPTDEGLAVVLRDITVRKQTESRDFAASRQIRQIFEAMSDGIVIIDSNWRFTFANQRALDLVGRSDILGHDIFELFPGNLEEPFHSTYRGTMSTRIPREFEAFHTAPLNLWLHVQAKPFEDGIIVFFSDISLRKHAELREQETARQLAEVLEATSDAVAALDREWRYTYLNTPAARLIDLDNNLIGRNIWEAFPAAVGGPAWDIYHRSMNEGVPGHCEVFYPEPINAWLELTSRPAPNGIVVFFRDITEQRTHDEIVRAQLDLLTAVQAVSRAATFEYISASGDIRYGPGAYPVFGHPLEGLDNMQQLERILDPEYVAPFQAQLARSIQSGSPFLAELPVISQEGSIIWIELRAQSAAAEGSPATLRGIFLDVTQRHLDQQDLVASESRYRVLADLNPNAIWMGDPQGNITYANHGFLAYMGLTSEDLRNGGWTEVLAPQDRARVLRVWSRSVITGVDFDAETLIRQKDTGEYRYWHLRAAPVRDATGAVLHWLGVGQDIHESKTYTAALRAQQMEAERRRLELESIYATTPVGLALLDPVHFTFLNLNEHEAQMLGGQVSSIIGRPLAEIAPPEKIPGLLDLMRSVAGGAVVRNHLLEGELATAPGEQRAWSVNYAPIYNEDGTVRAISTASVEITHQKKAEAALIQSEKLAAVGRLASSISHEINNPLEAITNLLYLISLDEQLPSSLKVYINMAQSELSRVSQIATQTLRFHRQAVAPTQVTAAELVDAVVRLYTGRLANSHITVDARYSTQAKVLCFENDIRQVLNNLIANAIDAMRTGGRLVVRAHQGSSPSPGLRITVADTGHGMSPTVLARIFEPFFTTKDLNGTGLGLWISAGIVDRHHGRLRARSSTHPGHHGTVFTLFLPFSGEGLADTSPEPH